MKIERMNKGSWGKVRAFFDVMTEEGFTIKGFKIIEGINGLFVSMPSQKGKEDEYFDTVYVPQELRAELNQIALQQYGMENSGPDNFNFPEKTEEKVSTDSSQTMPSEKVSADSSQAMPSEKVESDLNGSEEKVTYSDDDIPF